MDTSALIGLLRGDEDIARKVSEEDEPLCTCFPVNCELYRGTQLARRTEEGEKEVASLIEELNNLEADPASAQKMAELSERYPGISSFDLMIAGICLSHEATIITGDSDFQKIEELEVESI